MITRPDFAQQFGPDQHHTMEDCPSSRPHVSHALTTIPSVSTIWKHDDRDPLTQVVFAQFIYHEMKRYIIKILSYCKSS